MIIIEMSSWSIPRLSKGSILHESMFLTIMIYIVRTSNYPLGRSPFNDPAQKLRHSLVTLFRLSSTLSSRKLYFFQDEWSTRAKG
jgi:hypothetical protein